MVGKNYYFSLRNGFGYAIMDKIFFTGEPMLPKYLTVFFISMIPLVELRGAIPIALGLGLPTLPSILVCVVGNILPVPIIYFFARKFLVWGAKQRHIGKFCNFFLVKGEKAGQKLAARAGRGGLAIALMLFVGIPLPGTGAWTGTLGASFLNMGPKSTAASVCAGVVLAGLIMVAVSLLGLHIFGL
jgi:uncharacterized membrane protein